MKKSAFLFLLFTMCLICSGQEHTRYNELRDSEIYEKIQFTFQKKYLDLNIKDKSKIKKIEEKLEEIIIKLRKKDKIKNNNYYALKTKYYQNYIANNIGEVAKVKIGDSLFRKRELDTFFHNLIKIHHKLTNNPYTVEGGARLQNSRNKELFNLNISNEYKSLGFNKNLELSQEANLNFLNGNANQKYYKVSALFKQAIFKAEHEKFKADWYAQINQSAVENLNIRRRLIFGGGVFLNIYNSGNHYKNSSDSIIVVYNNRKLNNSEFKILKQLYSVMNKLDPSLKDGLENLIFCTEKLDSCTLISMSEDEKEEFIKLTNKVLKTYKKASSKFKINWKLGINHETENTNRPVKLYFRDSLQEQKIKATRLFRLETGPIINIKSGKLSLNGSLLAHFRILDNGNISDVINKFNTSENSRLNDYWLDLNLELGYELSKKTKLTINYNLVQLNAPKRVYLDLNSNIPNSSSNIKLFKSESKFDNFFIGIKHSIK